MSGRRPLPRRDLLRAGIAAALTAAPGVPALAQQKLSKQDAGYQDTPKDDHLCALCTLFQPPKACQVVAGDISSQGWCKLFEESPE